jgi:galactokinase
MTEHREGREFTVEQLADAFRACFGREMEFAVRAPGRVNLIGEHTDYNDGFVFPAALQLDVRIAGARRTDGIVRLHAEAFQQQTEFSLNSIGKDKVAPWSNYCRGVALQLLQRGHPLTGLDAFVVGTVPRASGLSSSAAIEMASCLAFEVAAGLELPPIERAQLCQAAEREFVGMNCGIMDQMISALGQANHAILIDTRHLQDYRPIPLPDSGLAILISDTRVPRQLVKSAYNERRAECEAAVEELRKVLPAVEALRDVGPEDLARHQGLLNPVLLKRARHVVHENDRTLRGVNALIAGDVETFGRLMNESHDSLRDDYEVSCTELDVLVESARSVEGVYGSRMTGAGFGGCTVSLVRSSASSSFLSVVGADYRRRFGKDPDFYVCRAADGAGRLV